MRKPMPTNMKIPPAPYNVRIRAGRSVSVYRQDAHRTRGSDCTCVKSDVHDAVLSAGVRSSEKRVSTTCYSCAKALRVSIPPCPDTAYTGRKLVLPPRR